MPPRWAAEPPCCSDCWPRAAQPARRARPDLETTLETIGARCAELASRPGAEVAASVDAFACALVRGDAGANGELFTDASRVQIARRPLLPFESRVRAAALDAGRPSKVTEVADRAAVEPATSLPDFVPVLLVRETGAWRVDLVEMGKAFYASGSHWRRRNARGPYWLALGAEAYAGEFADDLTPIELWGEPLQDAIARLERTDGPVAKVRLAELLLRAGQVDAGAALLRRSHAWRERREARPAASPSDLAESI